MIYSGPEAGVLPTMKECYARKVEDITASVIADTPDFYSLPLNIQDIIRQVAGKAAVAGVSDLPESALGDDERDTLFYATLLRAGIGPDSPYVTHHDVARAATYAIEMTEAVVRTGDVYAAEEFIEDELEEGEI